MKRKVNRVGINTLTVSLPSKWLKNNSVKKGDELAYIEKGNSITFTKGNEKQKANEITMNIDNFNKHMLVRYLPVLYRSNFNKITLLYRKSEIYDIKHDRYLNLKSHIKKLCDRFIGMDLVSQTSTKSEIVCFVTAEEEYAKNIEKRIYFLIKETIEELLKAIDDKKFDEFKQTVSIHHDNIVKFINYYLRMLDSANKNEYEKRQLMASYMIIDLIVDKIRHISEKIEKYGCTPKVSRYIKEIFGILAEQIDGMQNGEISKEHMEKVYDLLHRVQEEKFTVDEYKVISTIMIFRDTLNVFYETAIVKSLEKEIG